MENRGSGAVVLITHKRIAHLAKVIEALEQSWIDEYSRLIVVVHFGENRVLELVKTIEFTNPELIVVNRTDVLHAKEAISRNIFEGIERAYCNPSIKFVTIIEDDIVVRPDFLHFNFQVVQSQKENRLFRGVNGFSGAKFDENKDLDFGKFRYGFGWGWTITRQTWESVNEYWSSNFTSHWDALLEKYVRGGYVVMPHNSRILNLGFDDSATHTSNENAVEIKLQESYVAKKERFIPEVLSESQFDLNWRSDVIEFIEVNTPRGLIADIFWHLFNFLTIESSAKSSSVIISSRLRGLIIRILRII